MNYSAILLSGFLSVFATASVAQQPREPIYLDAMSGARIDLDAVSGSGPRKVVFARVSFVENVSSRCPEDTGALQIHGGWLGQSRMALLWDPEGQGSSNGWRSTLKPSDDETYQYRVALPGCRTDIAIRQQVFREGAWTTLLVRRELRPSVPEEERRELERQRLALPERRSVENSLLDALLGRELSDREAARQAAVAASQRKSLHEVPTFRQAFFFDEIPPTCFDASGYYRVERTGVVLSFPAPPDIRITPPPPGGVNRFLIERVNLDENRSRLNFTRGDCRWEITIGQSVLRSGVWVPVPIAPAPPPG
jgi:hypothetical protein